MFNTRHHTHPLSRTNSNASRLFAPVSSNATTPRHPSTMTDDHNPAVGNAPPAQHPPADGGLSAAEERQAQFRARFAQTEARLGALFSKKESFWDSTSPQINLQEGRRDQEAAQAPPPAPKKAARVIDEDDYGDDEDEEEDGASNGASSLAKPAELTAATAAGRISPPSNLLSPRPKTATEQRSTTSSSEQGKSSEEIRKQLQEDKQAADDAAKRALHTMFYTLETDRDAMLEQQRLDDMERQVEMETTGQRPNQAPNAAGLNPQQSSLANANLGASSLVIGHLLNAIERNRHMVKAQPRELISLIKEVRKNRSKWASEEKIGQEELYEAADSVLNQLKAMTEFSSPFLQRVNKREAPDYYNVIKHPMDFSTMVKKLKNFQYKSKKEFVDDLNLMWSNCLKYNTDPAHPLRKKAQTMQKKTDALVPLIPDIVIRDRAEVEAEERRMMNGDADIDGVEDSDDEEPIMASRGRKAPSKQSKKGTSNARKAPPTVLETTPGAETKPPISSLAGPASSLRNDFLRADSDAPMEGSQNGFTTPPPGTLTPLGPHGIFSSGAPPSQADVSEADGSGADVNGTVTTQSEELELDDLEFQTWKQVTKKARAMMAAERHVLFRGNRLKEDAPALLRSRAGMRRWMRQQKAALNEADSNEPEVDDANKTDTQNVSGETLAEGIEEEEERPLPDYYDVTSAIPDLEDRLKWIEDSEGQVIDQAEECLRMLPKGHFTMPESILTGKMEANMRQMQETRKICAKIGIVKQMQLQSQMYQNQFQKYDPQPLVEADIEPLVVADDGPIMSQWACRAALQRSVGKVFYHAGFEEFQPSALDAVTDVASSFFTNLVQTLGVYNEQPKVKNPNVLKDGEPVLKNKFTYEECVLHSLHQNGLSVEALENYVKDDVDRLGSKLGVMHERMKAHLAELLRPALDASAGADGVGAFNDGSEQFVGGDFAEDIDEDFFGFKELGLDKEFGLASLSVPLHLLQNRMHNAYAAANTSAISVTGTLMPQPDPFKPVTVHNIKHEIGLVHDFFLAKLRNSSHGSNSSNDDGAALIEDDELPAKQRFPKPRLPPTGKITSPRKRPIREQQQMAKKKRKLEDAAGKEVRDDGVVSGLGIRNGGGGDDANKSANAGAQSKSDGIKKLEGKLKLQMPKDASGEPVQEPQKEEEGSVMGMMSPESM